MESKGKIFQERPPRGEATWSIIFMVLCAAILGQASCPVWACFWCEGGGNTLPTVVALENQSSVRLVIEREGFLNLVQTVEYRTAEVPEPDFPSDLWHPARAGIDFLPASGTATFEVGQTATFIDILLIDNGLVDGTRYFRVELTHPSTGRMLRSGSDTYSIEVRDNEVGPALDPLFIPEAYTDMSDQNAWTGPGETVLISRDTFGLTLLQPTGTVDSTFSTVLRNERARLVSLDILQDGFLNLNGTHLWGESIVLRPVQVLPDGRILAERFYPWCWSYVPTGRLIRLLPSGAFDRLLVSSNYQEFVAVQSDGRILVKTRGDDGARFRRINQDGSPDPSFIPAAKTDVGRVTALQDDDKLLFLDATETSVKRLNADGSIDRSYGSAPMTVPIHSIFLRRDGKLLVGDAGGLKVILLRTDGSADPDFSFDTAKGAVEWMSSDCRYETPDGELWAATYHGPVIVLRHWTAHGTATPYRELLSGAVECGSRIQISSQGSEKILLSGRFLNVDGFPRRGLARFFTHPPERDFRVLTPAQFFTSSGFARIQVRRSGSSAEPASVSYTTRDATAKAGEDYLQTNGELHFAALEVSKEVQVFLTPGAAKLDRRQFALELSNPSAGYSLIASTPVQILPDLRVELRSAPRPDGSISITVRGTLPGFAYWLESSAALEHGWAVSAGPRLAASSTLLFDGVFGIPTSPSSTDNRPAFQFLRVVQN